MDFSELTQRYLRQAKADGASARTLQTYGAAFAEFAETGLSFTPGGVSQWKLQLVEAGQAPSSVNLKLSALSSLGRWAVQEEGPEGYLLDENPVARVRRPKARRPAERFLELPEAKRVLGLHLPVDFLLLTGLRVSEAVNCKVRDLHQGRLTVRLKGGRVSEVQLPAGLASRLEALAASRSPEAPLLVRGDGSPWNRLALTKAVARAARCAGITRLRVSAHVLRHTFNVAARAAGVDPTVRSRLLNHASSATLQKYEHAAAAEVDRARSLVASTLEG